MKDTDPQGAEKLKQVFKKINIDELPAMSVHVRELIALADSSRSEAYELAGVILKDYSLTNKILQVVNSAFYSLGRPVSSISKAVTIMGFDAVRDLATAIAIFEDFIKSGTEKTEISKLLTRSFLSAMQARDLVLRKEIKVVPEEAFICALLHNLGKIVVCTYIPKVYKKITQRVAGGEPEEAAAREELQNMTFQQVGKEIAAYWNLTNNLTVSMDTDPQKPKNRDDERGYLRNLANFTNRLVDYVCSGKDVAPLIKKYGAVLALDKEEAMEIMQSSVQNSEDVSGAVRFGLQKLKIRDRLRIIEEQKGGPPQSDIPGPGPASASASTPPAADEAPAKAAGADNRSIEDFIREIRESLTTGFNINEFYINLLEAFYRGIGIDRVILAIITISKGRMTLIGRYGLGEIDKRGVAGFRVELANGDHAISRCLKTCKDMTIPPDTPDILPGDLQNMAAGRRVYLFPICLDKRAIGMFYLDNHAHRPKLDEGRIKAARTFRDFAVTAIRKLRQQAGS